MRNEITHHLPLMHMFNFDLKIMWALRSWTQIGQIEINHQIIYPGS